MKKHNGITLIALVITIIVLLILSGITIKSLVGENGIINRVKQAKRETINAQVIEYLDLKLQENIMNYYQQTEKEILQKTNEDIKIQESINELKKWGNEIQIGEVKTKQDKEYFLVELDEFVYEVNIEGAKYIGVKTDDKVEIEEGDITFVYEPSGWTNGDVEVEIYAKETFKDYSIFYKLESEGIWKEYKEKFVVDKNQKIYAKLSGVLNETAEVSMSITNIDKLSPMEFTPTVSDIYTQYFTINANTTDNEETADNALSGILGYRFSNDDGENWTEYQTSGTYQFKGLSAGTTYNVKVQTKDNAGNVTTASTVVTTKVAVAQIGTTLYATLADAVSAASTSTITMLANVSEDVTIPSGKNITLSLNSKTITGMITNNGTTLVQGGTINNQSGVTIINNSVFTVNSGNIQSNTRAITNNGTLNIKGGLLESSRNWTVYNVSGATINMTGGEIRRTGSDDVGTAVLCNGTMSITGGTIRTVVHGLVIRGGYAEIKNATFISTSTNSSESTVLSDQGGVAKVSNSIITASAVAAGTDSQSALLLYNSTVTGNINANVARITNISGGIKFSVYGLSATNIYFPTWTSYNGQDDMINYVATKETTSNGVAWSVNIYKSEHNNESGSYITHIYNNASYTSDGYICGFGYEVE